MSYSQKEFYEELFYSIEEKALRKGLINDTKKMMTGKGVRVWKFQDREYQDRFRAQTAI